MINGDVLSDIIIQLSENGYQFEEEKFEKLAEGDEKTIEDALVRLARKAKQKAFAPHSDFPVGAALLTEKGIYLGGNVEVSGRSTSVHAEMLAAYNAAFEGAEEFRAMSVSTPRQSADTGPCGLCQHTLSQFTDELRIIEDGGDGEHGIFYLSELIGDGYSASTRHPEYVTDKQ
jgi:cytidine deaminase